MIIPFIKLRRVWYMLSGLLVAMSILGIVVYGIPYGIDFTGGSLLEIVYTKEAATPEQIREALNRQNITTSTVQKAGERGYVIRMPEIDDATHAALLAELRSQMGINTIDVTFEEGDADANRVLEQRFDTVGPVIGRELKLRSIQALVLVLLAIMVFMALAFRRVSWPVKSWKYGVVSVIALFHDVIITLGAYVWASAYFGWEVDTAFVAALLMVLGYSINDSIVVFDRVRENLPRLDEPFADVVEISVNQTLARTINTGLSSILVLVAVYLFGGTTLRPFMFALIVGIFIGAYSSIFVANPLLVSWHLRTLKKVS
ncbi:MAG: protein translocase subunit SecF [Parcubacteria group bacterium]|nr:protein translocase subunit SecF [Parcubacteria group bacterium]